MPRPGLGAANLLIVGLIGAALLYGDGAITPAISVLNAIEGLKVDAPGLARLVMPITTLPPTGSTTYCSNLKRTSATPSAVPMKPMPIAATKSSKAFFRCSISSSRPPPAPGFALSAAKTALRLGCDHAGFQLKEAVKDYLQEKGVSLTDMGASSTEPSDYPDYARAVGELVAAAGANLAF